MKRRNLIMLLFLAMGLSAMAQSTSRKFELSNSTDGKSILYCYLPIKSNGRAVVDCPGGGYSHLAIDHEGHHWAEYFNAQGIAYFVLKYRMPNGDRTIPLSDAYHAMKTVRDSASVWQINPDDVGIMGFSAGGHLASTVSTHAEYDVRPNFSILFYPVISMQKSKSHKGSCMGFLGSLASDKNMIREWSSDQAVRAHLTPRSIVILANDDHTVPPVTNGVAYYSAMRNAGNECTLHVYPDGDHGFGFRTTYKYHDQMLNDLTNWLNSFKAPKTDAIRVACIGNSITDGFGIDMADEKGYPANLQKLLGKDYIVKNYGVSSRTLLNKGDYPYQNEMAWRDALAFKPNVVFIKLGTNDSKPYVWQHHASFQNDYQQMIDTLKSLPSNPKIYICTPIPGTNEKWGITDQVIVDSVIPEIRKVAERNHLPLVDLHSLYKNEDGKQLLKDGVHPSAKGAKQLAQIIYDVMTSKIDVAEAKASKKKGKKAKKAKK